ncbi:hypothetical protein P3T23_009458 [Paraburkholderia sp. GAS448]|uniref:hypothetical protein n=1 Tax=Paraburkholderia sp. GAS448 TaxID=3035136 RepID=UPI003D1E7754
MTKTTISRGPRKPRRRRCPPIGALMRYGERIVRVVAEASGQRAIIESVDDSGRTFRSTVKWANLADLNVQLF